MVWEIFFVAVDSDQILKRAGYSRFLMRLEFGKIDDDISLDNFSGNQVLMPF